MTALTFNVIIPPADLSGVFTLHGIHYEKQSRSPGLALPGELAGWPCGCQLACSASVCRVLPQNSSCLRGYCQARFARNVSENQAQAQRAGCMVCGSAISADNKSPMPGCCFHCQSKQEVEFENVQEQEPALQTSAGLASPKPITREPSPPPLPPPADPPPDSSPTLRQCLECRAVSQKKNNASHCVEILEEGFPHSDLVKCGIW